MSKKPEMCSNEDGNFATQEGLCSTCYVASIQRQESRSYEKGRSSFRAEVEKVLISEIENLDYPFIGLNNPTAIMARFRIKELKKRISKKLNLNLTEKKESD